MSETGRVQTPPIPSRCVEACWTPVPCPTCGNRLYPRGRSVPLADWEGSCCLAVKYDAEINPRHLWSEHDEERWRFYPDEEPKESDDD